MGGNMIIESKDSGPPANKQRPRKKQTRDQEEEEEPELVDTIFVRNLARFDTTQESFKEYIEKNFGETVYCLICKDKETGESKGTGFVKFKSAETAQRVLEEYEDPEHQTKFFLDGRNLFVLPALTRDKINEVKRAVAPVAESTDGLKKKKKKPRHNRAKPISQPADNSAKAPTKSAHPQHFEPLNGNKKDREGPPNRKVKRQDKKGGYNQKKQHDYKKQAQQYKSPKPGGTKVKKDLRKKKKNLAKKANKKPRGRHSR